MQANQQEVDSIRAASLSGATNRQIAHENKRLEAASAIWNVVVDLGKLRFAAEIAGSLKLPEIAKRIRNGDAKVRQMMDTMIAPLVIDKLPGVDAAKHRLFVTESVWAAYSAYSTVLHISVTRLKLSQLGLEEADEMLKLDSLNKIVSTALPHHEAFIKEHGPSSYHVFVDDLERLVLAEIRNMLEGKEADAAAVRRNVEILKAVDDLRAKAESAKAESVAAEVKV